MATFNPKCIILLITITSLLSYLCESRHHKHTFKGHKHHHSHPHSHSHPVISMPPSSPPPSDDPAKAPSSFPSNIFDVRDFGAVGDGVVDDTDAFESAWDAACNFYPSNSSSSSSLPSLIHAPLGYTFMVQPTIFSGPCLNHLVFQIDGFVVPPDGPESWADTVSKRQWLIFYKIDGMSLLGGGCVDGRGHKWWDLPCKPHKGVNGTTLPGPCDSPIAIRFFESSNLRVKGLKIKDSPQFHLRFDNCQNVRVESIQITAPPLSPNTDGIHIENTNNVGIYNSLISNGDDCVSIGSGCYDVDIRNMTCWHGHGLSIGSLGNHKSKACVGNVTVRDSLMKQSSNGVRIKTWQGGSGSVSGVRFDNIHMDAVRNPIIIDQFYCLGDGCSNKTSAVWVNDIVYSNLKGTYDVRSPPMHFACSDAVPCANITLSDIELLPSVGDLVSDPFCWNVYGNLETLTIPPVSCLLEGAPPQPSILDSGVHHC